MAHEVMLAETVTFAGHKGNMIGAYFACPLDQGPFPSAVVIHHMPGWDESSKEITQGYLSRI